MNRLIAVLQLLLATVLFTFAALCLLNIIFVANRPETISVVNAFIGLGLLAVCLAAFGRIMLKKGLAGWYGTGKHGLHCK
ncbi:MAG: hypothetical protein WD772_05175 [Pseudohongiellaceae bacterium]